MDSRLRTLIRTFAVIGAIGAAVLPFYQQFLHGGRGAADIAPRTAEYLSAHMVGAFSSILLVFGLIAIHLKHTDRTGLFGLIAVMTVICGQMAWAAGLLVDGTFNPLLAIYNPELQSSIHDSAHHSAATPVSSDGLGPLLNVFTVLFAINVVTYLAGYTLFGLAIIRARVMPRTIGALLLVGAALVTTSLFTPPWAESVGYVALATAFIWAALMLGRPASPRR